MKNIILLFILLIPIFLFAQYPATGNKQRLGYQTTGDGLIWRGVAADTATKPRTINNAYFQLDTVNGILRRYIATRGKWQTVSGGSSALTMPFDSITFNPTTVDPDTAELKYNADLETFVFGADGTIIEIGQKTAWYVKNQSGSTINKGTVVRAAGTLGSSGRILIEPMEIDGTVNSKYLLGITASNIANNADGYVIHFGKLRKFNTSAFTDGAVLYADAAGGLTATEPNPPDLRLPIAFVVHSHATNGVLAIRIQTGNMLDELHDVDTTGIVSNGTLVWDEALSKWKPAPPDYDRDSTNELQTLFFDGGTGDLSISDGNNVSLLGLLNGYTSGTGTAGRLPYWNTTTSFADSPISYNSTTKRTTWDSPGILELPMGTDAQRPTATTSDFWYNTTGNGIEWYQGSRWAKAPEFTFNRGTQGRLPFPDANGQYTESSSLRWDESAKQFFINTPSATSPTYHLAITSTGTISQRWIGLFNSAGVQQAAFTSDGSGNGGIYVYNSSGVLQGRFSAGNETYLLGKVAFGNGLPGTADFLVQHLQTDIGLNARINIGGSGGGFPGVGYNVQFSSSANTYTKKSTGVSYFLDFGTSGRFAIKTSPSAASGSTITWTEALSILNSTNFVGINQVSPQRQLHVTGEARITDLTTDTPTRIVGADADGDLGEITVSTGLNLASGVLTATGATTWLKTELEASRDVTINGGSSTDFRIQNTRIQFDGKTKIGSDSSFVHDPSVDSTKIAGTVSFGKPSTLGAAAASAYPFVFRNPGSFSTYLLIESGRINPTGGAAGLKFVPSGQFPTIIQYGTTTGKALQFNDAITGKNVLQLGSGGFVSGNNATVLLGIDDPGQWGNNGRLVIYDTITSGKALFLAKKATSSSTPLAMFSSAANDRFTFDDNGTTRFHTYGAGNKEAADLSKTESVYSAWYATDGTVIEKRANTEQYFTITSTSSPQTLSNNFSDNLINQGGTQATFTLTFPASPVDGQVLKITYNNAITTLTLDGNGNTIVGSAVTTGVAGSQRAFKFYTGIGWIKLY